MFGISKPKTNGRHCS